MTSVRRCMKALAASCCKVSSMGAIVGTCPGAHPRVHGCRTPCVLRENPRLDVRADRRRGMRLHANTGVIGPRVAHSTTLTDVRRPQLQTDVLQCTAVGDLARGRV